jgi:hypothetical protein
MALDAAKADCCNGFQVTRTTWHTVSKLGSRCRAVEEQDACLQTLDYG